MSKPLWIVLLLISGLLTLWRGVIAMHTVGEYSRHQVEVPIQVTHVDVVPKGGKYTLALTYKYKGGDKNFLTTVERGKPYHLNKEAAEHEARLAPGLYKIAWMDSKRPGSTLLESLFPFRAVLYALSALGVFLYFIFLRFHIEIYSGPAIKGRG